MNAICNSKINLERRKRVGVGEEMYVKSQHDTNVQLQKLCRSLFIYLFILILNPYHYTTMSHFNVISCPMHIHEIKILAVAQEKWDEVCLAECVTFPDQRIFWLKSLIRFIMHIHSLIKVIWSWHSQCQYALRPFTQNMVGIYML